MAVTSASLTRGSTAIARLAAGVEQTSLFTGLQAPVARTSAWRQFDVAHRIVDIDPPFLARHLEDMVEQHQVAFHGRCRDLGQALVTPAGDVDTADPREGREWP